MEYTIYNLRDKFPDIKEYVDAIRLLDSSTRQWLMQFPERIQEGEGNITDFLRVDESQYHFVVDGKITILKGRLENIGSTKVPFYRFIGLDFQFGNAEKVRKDFDRFLSDLKIRDLENFANSCESRYEDLFGELRPVSN